MGQGIAAGPDPPATLRAIIAPSAAFSPGVVRINVTVALWWWNVDTDRITLDGRAFDL